MQTFAHLEALYLPDKVLECISRWGGQEPPHYLLERSLDTPDWSLEQLWEAAAYHHHRYAYPKASRYYHRLLEWTERNPQAHAEVMTAIGHAYLCDNKLPDARQVLDIGIKLNPSEPKLYLYRADCATRQGEPEIAIKALTQFLELYKRQDTLAAKCYRQLVSLYDSSGDSQAAQTTLLKAAQQLNSHLFATQARSYQPLLPFTQELAPLPESAFDTLSLPGKIYYDEIGEWYIYRSLWRLATQTALGTLQQAAQSLNVDWPQIPPTHQDNQRIVFVGGFHRLDAEPFLDSIIALSRKRAVTVFSTGPIPARLREEEWMRVIEIPDQAMILHEQIAAIAPALLIFLDLGPHSGTNLMLASARMAPVQAVLPTYPVSTGHPAIDYYLSYDWLESEQAQADYSEKLIRLAGMPIRSSGLPDRFIERERFNLPADKRFYFCPVTCGSLHPDFIDLIAEILIRDPQGTLLLPRSTQPVLDQQFIKLFQARWPQHLSQLGILGKLDRLAFLSVAHAADVILDPYQFGLTQAAWPLICLGTPIITCPGQQARSRYVSALYQQLGLTESIATNPEHYAELAVSLAQNPELKNRYRYEIRAKQRQIFDYTSFLPSFEQFIDQALQEALVKRQALALNSDD